MAVEEQRSDFNANAVFGELIQLERMERAISGQRRKLHDRIDLGFASAETQKRERELSDERLALHRRIDALRAELASMGVRVPPPAV
jgi:hypothetical protein